MQPTQHFKSAYPIASFIGAIFISLACTFGAQAQTSNEWQMPMDVMGVPNAGRVQAQGKVEVVEFFWYGCSHCAVLEPKFSAWRKTQPKDVQIVTLPVSWNAPMVNHQRIYFTLEVLNRLDLHARLFGDVPASKNYLATPQSAQAWAIARGIPQAQWQAAFNSAEVTRKMQFAQQQFERFGLSGVPTLIVDGQYWVISTEDTIATLNALVANRLSMAP